MGTVKIRLIFGYQLLDSGRYHGNISSNDRQIYSSLWPKLLNIYTFLRWNFFTLCQIMEMMLLTFWIGKKSRLLRRFFQYSVICHSSKCIRLAQTDFLKTVFLYELYVAATEPNLKKKKITEGNAFCVHIDVIKIGKHWRFPLSARRLLELSSYGRVQSS